ncbi:MAG: 2-C-methyl-D-erythritol 4-phosphate cytidylyltransferase [Hornefia sp.]|nr:2-C-methyl-D-erythritol 4-phosphate cytidylyltransferase [Hornefia sp.]
MIFGVILAGGNGNRMGNTDKPKQFLEIAGKPIIVHTIEKFLCSNKINKIIVLCPEIWKEYTEKLCREYFADKDIAVISGGDNRNETLMNGINYIEKKYGIDKNTALITHDSVRPFITKTIIEENISYLSGGKICTTAVPSTDTIFISRGGDVVDMALKRKECYQVQTPQSFFAMDFKKCYNELSDDERKQVTDAMGVFILNKYEVSLVAGRNENMKITYLSDLHVAEKIFELEKDSVEV